MYACKHNAVEAINFLLEKGANINAKDKIGFTPLMCAVRSGRYKLCQMLLHKGADVNSISKVAIVRKDVKIRITALTISLEYKHYKITALLLTFGATIMENTDKIEMPPHIRTLLVANR